MDEGTWQAISLVYFFSLYFWSTPDLKTNISKEIKLKKYFVSCFKRSHKSLGGFILLSGCMVIFHLVTQLI